MHRCYACGRSATTVDRGVPLCARSAAEIRLLRERPERVIVTNRERERTRLAHIPTEPRD
jgi:hypothetical protein